ncbi:Eukaryotic translation initiation factor 3 subunit H like protein [Aduncisulcus paluster]|uniref:Eukaryotic translation initiation factor 3 subunit H like protein n=1 Tax=Aduncisulcus paluster TaxID=2918883 RepID=A0ABQ5KX37_9EUKA|nr:Eukaryotic translation initiation factor 3 subunit H like protein [Aduncisulcus paluster]|eukprot:gnl/Carplike_NY0171/1127_a1532_1469.p1 GENE.gnl/Carplike_NY0171/1127_a1532_1469~~gnl/Carplike_NY0171/1127_a1532_1469.p1  ORF type:complete len:273 (+),score=56.55 gnl/Carplike_NY0171/1127_a1532_1469:2-820(+)
MSLPISFELSALYKLLNGIHSSLPEPTLGSLVGCKTKHGIYIAECLFPSDERSEDDKERYRLKMLECYRELGIEYDIVGLFTTSHGSSHLDEEIIKLQADYQKRNKESVLVLYDPASISGGSMKLTAVQLKPRFLEVFSSTGEIFPSDHDQVRRYSLDTKIFDFVPISFEKNMFIENAVSSLKVIAPEVTEAPIHAPISDVPAINSSIHSLISSFESISQAEKKKTSRSSHSKGEKSNTFRELCVSDSLCSATKDVVVSLKAKCDTYEKTFK